MSTIEKHDMTRGKILLPLVSFTIPLVLGNLFQLTYNAADSVIVGKYVGEQALAAVGTSTPIMNIAILLISGMCMGASVLMSSQYGAKDYDTLSKQISTTMLAGCGFSVVFSLLMLLLATPVLRLIRVPETAIPEAAVYLRIIFLGLIFTFIYNFLANTMRALGDSKTPLYFLITSAFLNIFGDLFFVVVLRWGVAGSAIATVCSEGLCCLLCGIYIKKKIPLLCLGKKWWVFDKSLLGKTVSFGSTSAMQQVCLQLGKLIIQSVVNTQGVAVDSVGHSRHEERLSDRIVDRAGLFHRFVCSDLGSGPADHDFVRRGWRCAGGISRNQLPAPDLLDVYPAGNDQRNPGIFPRHRRSEGDTVQYLYEYVGQSCGSICNDPSAAYGLRKLSVGEYDRMDRDAII